MQLTRLQRSISKRGGWLIAGKPKREAHAVFNTLPSAHCRFLTGSDVWWVDDDALNLLESRCENWATFCSSVGYTPRRSDPLPFPRSPEHHTSPYAAMYLMDNAPDEVVEAVWRALAKMLHPDLNKNPDSAERMIRLIRAHDAIIAIQAKRKQQKK